MSQKKSTLRAHAPRAAALTEKKIIKKVPIYELGMSNTSVSSIALCILYKKYAYILPLSG